jgi:hypothetical protein
MICYSIILGSSGQFPWTMVIGLAVFVLIMLARVKGSASRTDSPDAAPKPPPAPIPPAPIPPAMFAGVQAGRLVAPPPPPPRRVRKLAAPPPPPPPRRRRAKSAATASETPAFPEARGLGPEAQAALPSDAESLPSSSILDELRSPGSVRAAIILTELLERPAVLREGQDRPQRS